MAKSFKLCFFSCSIAVFSANRQPLVTAAVPIYLNICPHVISGEKEKKVKEKIGGKCERKTKKRKNEKINR